MSTLMKNVVQSALKADELNIIVMNAKSDIELAGFNFNVYTFNLQKSLVSTILTNDILERNLCIYFDAVVNLRPFNNDLNSIISFSENWQIPIINYIIDINAGMKKENRMRQAEIIQKMMNFYEREEFASQVYIPNAVTLNRTEFTAKLQEIL